MSSPIPGHLFGPPPPHIAFYFGDRYLTEVRGHPLAMPAALEQARRHIEVLEPSSSVGPALHMLSRAKAVVICGPVSMSVAELTEASRGTHQLDFLLMLKGFSRAPVSANPKYVLTVILSDDGQYAVGLIKSKGPEHLIGKITFPGGRVDPGEQLEEAAARELYEETGLTIAPSKLVNIANSPDMAVFAGRSSDALKAITREDEEVVVLAVRRHMDYVTKTPQAYVPEFRVFLLAAAASV